MSDISSEQSATKIRSTSLVDTHDRIFVQFKIFCQEVFYHYFSQEENRALA